MIDARIDPNVAIEEFGDAQGNILKGHGREFTALLFVEFTDPDLTRIWLQTLLNTPAGKGGIISTAQQLADRAAHRANPAADAGLFASLLFTAMGLRWLGADLPAEAPDQLPGQPSPSEAFAQGMRNVAGRGLADPEPAEWAEGWFEAGEPTTIHALLLLASDQAAALAAAVAAARTALAAAHITVRLTENGQRLTATTDGKNYDIEHFKYADGVSQPLYLTDDEGAATPHSRDKALRADELVLLRDPLGREKSSYGSFLVFRKLEQDVAGFKNEEKALANGLGLKGDDSERAGAMLVGRFENGTPVTLRVSDGTEANGGGRLFTNDFTYADDPDGMCCPFHAHIRKMNPRGETNPQNPGDRQEMSHRITRRGVPYGAAPDDETEPDGQNRGLLFICYQRNIEQQFEFLQKSWANDPTFLRSAVKAGPDTGLDPIIGQGDRQEPKLRFPLDWKPAPDDSAQVGEARFEPHVRLQGGEYFYAPSMSGLRALATAPQVVASAK